jgi:hypothetical protein
MDRLLSEFTHSRQALGAPLVAGLLLRLAYELWYANKTA